MEYLFHGDDHKPKNAEKQHAVLHKKGAVLSNFTRANAADPRLCKELFPAALQEKT